MAVRISIRMRAHLFGQSSQNLFLDEGKQDSQAVA